MKRIALIAALASTSLLASNASADNTEMPQDTEQPEMITQIAEEGREGDIDAMDVERDEFDVEVEFNEDVQSNEDMAFNEEDEIDDETQPHQPTGYWVSQPVYGYDYYGNIQVLYYRNIWIDTSGH